MLTDQTPNAQIVGSWLEALRDDGLIANGDVETGVIANIALLLGHIAIVETALDDDPQATPA